MTTINKSPFHLQYCPTWHDYCNDQTLSGPFENQILYRMCHDHGDHDDPYVTAGKVIAIGRIYAASPERGGGKGPPDDITIFRAVADRLKTCGLDAQLASFNHNTPLSAELLQSAIKAHNWLVTQISDATKGWSTTAITKGDWAPRQHRSFASKYLHFHRPNIFPIMDRYSEAGLRCGGAKLNGMDYQRFCDAFETHLTNIHRRWTLREIDRDLVAKGRGHSDQSPCPHCGRHKQQRKRKGAA